MKEKESTPVLCESPKGVGACEVCSPWLENFKRGFAR